MLRSSNEGKTSGLREVTMNTSETPQRVSWPAIILGLLLTCTGTMSNWVAAESVPTPAPPLPAPPAQQTIKGDILNIEGEHLVLKDLSGHEVRLRVDKDTKMERLKVGDKVVAMVSPDGHAETIQIQLTQ
jgi:hypothetical protein